MLTSLWDPRWFHLWLGYWRMNRSLPGKKEGRGHIWVEGLVCTKGVHEQVGHVLGLEGHSVARKQEARETWGIFLSHPLPAFPYHPWLQGSLALEPPSSRGSWMELCVFLHVCVLVSTLLAWAQLRWWQAAFCIWFVLAAMSPSLFVCYFYSMFSHCLPVQLPSVAVL